MTENSALLLFLGHVFRNVERASKLISNFGGERSDLGQYINVKERRYNDIGQSGRG